ncbi:restriction endonuclease subunit S [Desulforhopalus sp. IMCC35007]|uniref:restriction endonuclease subunit S n=1 Tax=Desulforhopalus sp. IMCC35007 TaxID=2569543 RepID=UPI0010AE01DD|nr:restriction endonuclease subunit S [Desulforhopalus sp. IMCC35007]TKB07453.1 restriction endonuclease subunit S [Desulforhopalus sp. IMCC35007]
MMVGKYQRYAEYKESGVEWVGNIPGVWEVKPLLGTVTTESIKNVDGNENNVLSLSYGNIIRRDVEKNFGLLPESFNTYQMVDPGNLILRLTDLQNDKRSLRVGRAIEKGIITSAYLKLVAKPHTIDDRFLYRLLHSYDTTKVFYGMGGGLRQSMKFEEMRRLPILVPPIDEQSQIANFLDHETAKIDTLIEKQQQLIALLKEKRQAVISHAVTKGLNPDAPMRDSGVEWLGEVPEHWEMAKVKFYCLVKGRIGFRGYTTDDLVEETEGAVVIGATEMNSTGEIQLDNPQYISWKKYYESPEIMLGDGMVLVVQRGSTVGKIAVVKAGFGKATINPSLIVLRDLNIDSDYLKYSLMATFTQSIVKMQTSSTAIPMISQEQVGNYTLLVPGNKEQIEIARYITTQNEIIDKAMATAQKSISLLQERRTSLISAAVTGKIDVRNWQPPTAHQNILDTP